MFIKYKYLYLYNETNKQKQNDMAFANNTLEELDQKICDIVNIDIEDYKKMTLSEKFEVREQARQELEYTGA